MHREEIKRTLHQACGNSTLLQRSLFTVMDWLTGQSWHVRRELRKWLKTAPRYAHILDAGSGYGHQAYWLSEQNSQHSILAIDTASEHVARGNTFARESGLQNLFFRKVSLDDYCAENAFDLILCTDAIANVTEAALVLENLHRSLRDNGLLLATVRRRSPDIPPVRPAYGYEMAEIKQKLKDAGFKKVKAHFTGGVAGQAARNIGVRFPLWLLKISRLFAVLIPFYFMLAIPLVVLLNWLDSHTAQMSGKGILVLARK